METIKDFYCNGYFGRRYDLRGSQIIDESNYSITISVQETGEVLTATFEDVETKEETKKEWTSGF